LSTTGRIAGHVEAFRRRQQLAPAEMVVEEQAEADQPSRPQALGIGQHEAHRPDDMRRVAPQHLALHQRFAHQPKFIIFEVAQPAMDQLGRPGRGAARQILHFRQIDGVAAAGRITGDAAAIDAASDDEDVMDRGFAHTSSRFRTAPFPRAARKHTAIISNG
jgi:hypothetical protein